MGYDAPNEPSTISTLTNLSSIQVSTYIGYDVVMIWEIDLPKLPFLTKLTMINGPLGGDLLNQLTGLTSLSLPFAKSYPHPQPLNLPRLKYLDVGIHLELHSRYIRNLTNLEFLFTPSNTNWQDLTWLTNLRP
jgi:hypothetical protein